MVLGNRTSVSSSLFEAVLGVLCITEKCLIGARFCGFGTSSFGLGVEGKDILFGDITGGYSFRSALVRTWPLWLP